MRVKSVVIGETLIHILQVYEEQNVKQCECNVETFHLLFFFLYVHTSCVTMDKSHVSIGILKEAMYPSLFKQN